MSDFEAVDSAWRRYVAYQDRYSRAATAVRNHVEAVAASAGVTCAVSARPKTASEFLKKALRKGRDDPGYLVDPWRKITDKAGARAVVRLLEDVDNLHEAVRDDGTLPIVEVIDSRTADPRQLTYRGLHLQVLAPREDEDVELVECELQIRTEAQDLWAPISHRFLYKPLLDLPFETQRSLHRLVSLMEMFDEEVQRAVRTIRDLPGYSVAEFLDLAEREFLSLVPFPDFDRGLSLQVLDVVARSVDCDIDAYGDALAEFVSLRRNEFILVLNDYGPSAGASARYALLSQPECVVLIERLENAPSTLGAVWREAELPESMLQAVAGVWGVPI